MKARQIAAILGCVLLAATSAEAGFSHGKGKGMCTAVVFCSSITAPLLEAAAQHS
jgi:hypothetical protein